MVICVTFSSNWESVYKLDIYKRTLVLLPTLQFKFIKGNAMTTIRKTKL